MAERPVEHLLASARAVLTEGSIYERLRRHPGVAFDAQIAHAGLIYDEPSATILGGVHREYVREATRAGLPMIVGTGTMRANRERLARSGFARRAVNQDQVAFVRAICREEAGAPLYVAGVLGPRGDAYRPDPGFPSSAARELHAWQASALADAGADLLIATTLPAVAEAFGIALAIADTGLPYVLSFVVRADATVLDGTSLAAAIDMIDQGAHRPPMGYAINCVHSSVLDRALERAGERAVSRIIGYRANTSPLRPEELDGSAALLTEPAPAFADQLLAVARKYELKLIGGCCGSGTEHIAALARRLTEGA
jgi:homocysteine S-methyltransferase